METETTRRPMEEVKRARKRSRYLSPPYTDDGLDPELPDCGNLAAADMLSALQAAALLDLDGTAGGGVKVLLRFFGLHRSSSSLLLSTSSPGATADAKAEAGAEGSSKNQKKKKKKKTAGGASTPRPSLRRLPLTDIRKNLEKMISSLGRSPSNGAKLAGEMRCLLAKVDKMLAASSPATATATTTTALHHSH